MKFNTSLLHSAHAPEEKNGATLTPIYQSSAFAHQTAEDLEAVFNGKRPGFVYTRLNNPSVDSFEQRVAALESGIGAIACASGMAAVTLAILNLVKSGDEVVASSGIFGGTTSLFHCLEEFNITTQYAADNRIESFAACISPRTKVIFIETIGNPKLDVPDIAALAELAHQHEILLVVDNTVTTPFLVKPIKLGADVVIHSTSKYINGSGNSIGGIIIDSGKRKWNYDKFPAFKEYEKFGRFAYLAKLRKGIFKDFGACMSPFNAYLTSIGMETLGLRMERACETAYKLAVSLRSCAKVKTVNYPGLEDSPYYQVAKAQFNGKFGAMLTIRVGTKDNAFAVINSLTYAANLANIGDTRTLVIHPASTIYAASQEAEKINAGAYDDLIRISVGLEDFEDLEADFQQALDKLA